MRVCVAIAVTFGLFGCERSDVDPSTAALIPISGDYYVRHEDESAEVYLCRRTREGGCEPRTPADLRGYGVGAGHLTAAVEPRTGADSVLYFVIDRSKDVTTVRLSLSEFERLKASQNLPDPTRRPQNASAGTLMRTSAPVLSLARCALASGRMRSTK